MKIIEEAGRLLSECGFKTRFSTEGLLFEDRSVFGIVKSYDSVSAILGSWEEEQSKFIDRWSASIRVASTKRWNAYLCLLTAQQASDAEEVRLVELEEDLQSMRKIAADNIKTTKDVKRALYPLLPIQSLASLEEQELGERLESRTSLKADFIKMFVDGVPAERIAEHLLEEAGE